VSVIRLRSNFGGRVICW